MRATISLLGLYNYDNSILDGLTLPSNFTSDDLTALKNNLLVETAEFEVLYTDPNFLKFAITQWCEKRKSTWKWLKDTQGYDYVPIWNADYTIKDVKLDTHNLAYTDDTTNTFNRYLKTANSGNDVLAHSGNNALAHTGTDSDAHTGTIDHDKTGNDKVDHDGYDELGRSGTDTKLNSVYAFDDQSNGKPQSKVEDTAGQKDRTTYNSNEKTTYNSGLTDTFADTTTTTFNDTKTTTFNDTETTTFNSADTTTHGHVVDETGKTVTTIDNDKTDTGTLKTDYDRLLQGNYGQTSTQELIKQEQQLALFNIIDFIITDFKKRFCLLVY